MANCPKCDYHLRLIDWKQHCPKCGANVFVYDLQERLMQQADSAEVEHYYFQQKVDRVKASFIGSKLAVTRIFTSILPIGPLFLPIVTASFSAPFEEWQGKVDFMTIYNKVDKLGAVTGLFSDLSKDNLLFLGALVTFALSLVLTVLHFALNTLACSPKGKLRNTVIDVLMFVFSAASVLLILLMGDTGAVTATLGIGAYLYLFAQAVNVAIDMLTLKKGIEIHHEQCYVGAIPIEEYFEMVKTMPREEIRAEQYKRLQVRFDEKQARIEAEEKAAKEKKEKERQEYKQ